MKTRPLFTWIKTLIVILVTVRHAHAYLDPGTGSVLVQLLLGGVAGLFVAAKLFWGRIRLYFTSLFKRNPSKN